MSEDEGQTSEHKPSLPPIEAPKVDIRPEIKEYIDNLAEKILPQMTLHERQYFIQRIGISPVHQKRVLPSAANPRKRVVEALPELKDWNQIMDAIESHNSAASRGG